METPFRGFAPLGFASHGASRLSMPAAGSLQQGLRPLRLRLIHPASGGWGRGPQTPALRGVLRTAIFYPRGFAPAAPFKKEANQGRGLRPPHPPGGFAPSSASPPHPLQFFTAASQPPEGEGLRPSCLRQFTPLCLQQGSGASPLRTPVKGLRPLTNPAMPPAGVKGLRPLTNPTRLLRSLKQLCLQQGSRGFAP